eukprot:CAMPEP_0118710126 /NCGR_PEP_ID=MMETSP0800-20121206/23150_1 /TAXON_ID=210618 ORGANISM="Striatella unipunctata, Strain CCMP2910" /NCGR_SAMPLE_ID=MMETSP0800 /ASSEMBLY_ACC=CAM_ASM_000638 /LENGTH=154 /DNA_ID=CAMNT_0006614157 /DNA_START=46 /DNA_END=510 /DNA_ORIENTATION=+
MMMEHLDGLSLSMFEALRELRDAVAPQKKEGGDDAATNDQSTPFGLDNSKQNIMVEMEHDTELVTKLSNQVMQKHVAVDEQVSQLPGMHRTKTQQLEKIEEIMLQIKQQKVELDDLKTKAEERREQIHHALDQVMVEALGMQQNEEAHEKIEVQ